MSFSPADSSSGKTASVTQLRTSQHPRQAWHIVRCVEKKAIIPLQTISTLSTACSTTTSRDFNVHADFHANNNGNGPLDDTKRVLHRTIIDAYGPSLKYFSSKLRLLHAVYDAVAGHKTVWLRSMILHRDIRLDNVFLGKEDAEPGHRGFLIDLDITINLNRQTNLWRGGPVRTETRTYQSVAVLRRQEWMNEPSGAPPQDHLDDLESFFYVLSWICLTHDGPGRSLVVKGPHYWDQPDPWACAYAKIAYLAAPWYFPQPYFRDDVVFRDLLKDLRSLCFQHCLKKLSTASDSKEPFPNLIDVYNSDAALSGQVHVDFLAIVQKAIDALEKREPEGKYPPSIQGRSGGEAQPPPSTIHAPSSTTKIASTSNVRRMKRRNTPESDEDLDVSHKRTTSSRSNSQS